MINISKKEYYELIDKSVILEALLMQENDCLTNELKKEIQRMLKKFNIINLKYLRAEE